MNPGRITAPKIALAGLFCFLVGVAWTAIVFAKTLRRARPGIGVIVGLPRAGEILYLVGFVLSIGACLFALVRTIYRRVSA